MLLCLLEYHKANFFKVECVQQNIVWEPMNLEESDCLIKTKQRDRLYKG